jgi:hypothetical protein
LADKLKTQWLGRTKIILKHPFIRYQAFEAMIQYIYTGSVNINTDYVDSFLALLKQCHFYDLRDKVAYLNNNREDQSDRLIFNATEQDLDRTLVKDLRGLWEVVITGNKSRCISVTNY